MSRRVKKATPSVPQVKLSPNLTACICIASDIQLTVTFLKDEKIDSRGHIILRKQQIVLLILKYKRNIFQCWSTFKCIMSTRQNEKTESNPFT